MPQPAHRAAPQPSLLAEAIAGLPDAKRRLVERHGPLVWGICRRLCPDPEEAYQEIWEKVLRALPGFDPEGAASLSTWVATIAHRALIDRHRRWLVRGEVLPLPDLRATDPSPEERLDARRQAAALERALAALPEPWRRIVVLHHINGVDLETLAAQEGVALGTIKSRLHRGRAALAASLGERR